MNDENKDEKSLAIKLLEEKSRQKTISKILINISKKKNKEKMKSGFLQVLNDIQKYNADILEKLQNKLSRIE